MHYIDIRDILKFTRIEEIINIEINFYVKNIRNIINYEYNINKLENSMQEIINYLMDLYIKKEQILNNMINPINKDNTYYLDKIINKYDDEELRNKLINNMNKTFNNYYPKINEIIYMLKYMIKELKELTDYIEIGNKIGIIERDIDDLYNKITNFNTDITDIYMLRRLLDKDYVKNAIIYTGLSHSVNYIEFLTKEYDFEIKYIQYSKINDLKILNKMIKIMDSDKILNMISEYEPLQCVKKNIYLGYVK